MPLMSADELRALVARVFEDRGVPAGDADTVARALVHANLRGTDSHGVLRVPHYVRRLDEGSINPRPQHDTTLSGPCTGTVDGDDGLGHVGLRHGMQCAIELARENGIGLVGVVRSSHCGALSFFAQLALEADLLAIVMTQTDSGVVPFGGRRPFFGTNPICIASPSRTGPPVMLDMATSTVAGGQIYSARAQNRPIPDTWALDAEGHPTTDPHRARFWTPAAGAKGYGLGAMVDVLTGVLMGGCFGPHIPPMYDAYDRRRRLCHLAIAVDYRRFPGREGFTEQIAAMVAELHAEPPAEGFDAVLAPGEPEYRREAQRLRDGIPLDDALLRELRDLAGPTER